MIVDWNLVFVFFFLKIKFNYKFYIKYNNSYTQILKI